MSKGEFAKLVVDERAYLDGRFNELITTINNLVTRVEHVKNQSRRRWAQQNVDDDAVDEDDDDGDTDNDADVRRAAREERLHQHLQNNHRGIWGNNDHCNNDLFAKAKFTMIPFAGGVDPEKYLDWELVIAKKI